VILCHIRNYLNFSASLAARLVGAKVIFQVIGFLHDPAVSSDREDPLETILPKVRLTHTLRDFFGSLFHRDPFSACWENFIFHSPLYRADARVTITEFEREKLQTVAGLDSTVIPWGISAEPPTLDAREPKTADGKSVPSDFLLLIAQIKRRKGWDTAVEALAALKRQGVNESLVFVTPSSPEECQEAYRRVEELGIADRVVFLRKISNEEKAWLFRRAKATLVPSRYEGFGLPIFESWAYGVPVLGTDIPVFTDFLRHRETGLVSKKGDPSTLAENIKLLADTNVRERVISGGRTMLSKYGDQQIIERFKKLMASITRDRALLTPSENGGKGWDGRG
jgi:glycosyltransferase involved in cell wall biosynthesis